MIFQFPLFTARCLFCPLFQNLTHAIFYLMLKVGLCLTRFNICLVA